MESKLSTVHYISTHSASLMILLDAATTDIFIYGNTQPNFFGDIRRKSDILHSDKYSNIRHAEQGKRE